MTVEEQMIRKMFEIPEGASTYESPEGDWHFDWYDSSIRVTTEGKATKTWMGYSSDEEIHKLFKREIQPKYFCFE